MLEIEQLDLEENEAKEVLAAMEASSSGAKRRTWKDGQQLKRDIKKDRRFFDSAAGPRDRDRKPREGGRRRLSIEDVKK